MFCTLIQCNIICNDAMQWCNPMQYYMQRCNAVMQSNAILYALSDDQCLPYCDTRLCLFVPKLKLWGSLKIVSHIWIWGKNLLGTTIGNFLFSFAIVLCNRLKLCLLSNVKAVFMTLWLVSFHTGLKYSQTLI